MQIDTRVPNAETRRAIAQLETPAKRAKLKRHARTEDMFADISNKQGKRPQKKA